MNEYETICKDDAVTHFNALVERGESGEAKGYLLDLITNEKVDSNWILMELSFEEVSAHVAMMLPNIIEDHICYQVSDIALKTVKEKCKARLSELYMFNSVVDDDMIENMFYS